jgi:hypothetical protein
VKIRGGLASGLVYYQLRWDNKCHIGRPAERNCKINDKDANERSFNGLLGYEISSGRPQEDGEDNDHQNECKQRESPFSKQQAVLEKMI